MTFDILVMSTKSDEEKCFVVAVLKIYQTKYIFDIFDSKSNYILASIAIKMFIYLLSLHPNSVNFYTTVR